MTYHRLEQTDRSQRGFTLVEVLVAIAITGVIGGGITAGIFQILDQNASISAHMAAIKEVENSVHWITRDVQMAQTLTDTGLPLTLTWVEWDDTSNAVTYNIQNGQLQRILSVNGGEPTMIVLARHIDADMTSCTRTGDVLDFKITATVGGFRPASETRSFKIILKSAN